MNLEIMFWNICGVIFMDQWASIAKMNLNARSPHNKLIDCCGSQ